MSSQLKKSNIELIYKAYDKSRAKPLIKEYFPNILWCQMPIIILFGLIILYFQWNGKLLYFFIATLSYLLYITIESNKIKKYINNKIKNDIKFKEYHSENLYTLFSEYKLFYIKFYNLKYSEIVYFNYLISNLNIKETNFLECVEYLKYKTKDYTRITERSIFNVIISLIISFGISFSFWYIDKIKDLVNIHQKLLYFGISIFIIISLLIIAYQIFYTIELKSKKDKEIKDILLLFSKVSKIPKD